MQEENSSEQQEREDRSIGELFSELSQKTTTLVRQEIELAKAVGTPRRPPGRSCATGSRG